MMENSSWMDRGKSFLSVHELHTFLEEMTNDPVTMIKVRVDSFYQMRKQIGLSYACRYIKEFTQMLENYFAYQQGISMYDLSSDEFCLIVTENSQQVISLAQNLVAAGKYFYTTEEGVVLNSTLTVGVATGVGFELLTHTEAALRCALHKPGSIVVYEALEMKDEASIITSQTLQLISEAIEHDDIIPYFQPIMELKTNRICSYECLVRIEHEGKIYLPSTFLDMVLNTHQISTMTRLMVRKSFEFFSHPENREYTFSLNLSSDDLQDETLTGYIRYWLEKFNMSPNRVSFEILESVDLYLSPLIQQTISTLKLMGCRISIDDFGTGYSNFLQLLTLQPDFIKIDGSFVQRVATEPKFEEFFSKIVQLIHLCGAECIAEYVSSQELIECLYDLGVDYVQGYAIGIPSPSLA